MQGFINRTIPLALRRLVTMAPALVVLGIGLDPSRALVISQVVLSFGIPFALVPLVLLTRRRSIMGALVNRPLTTALASRRGGADHRPERVPGHSDVRLGLLDFPAAHDDHPPGDGGTCDAIPAGAPAAPVAFTHPRRARHGRVPRHRRRDRA